MFNRYFIRMSLTVMLGFIQMMAFAQDNGAGSSVEKTMYSQDKIYVVMAVCIVILLVMILYLVRIDRKITRREKLTEK